MKTLSKIVLPFAIGSLPFAVSAQTIPPPPPMNPVYFLNLLCSIGGWFFSFLIVFSIIAVLLAAFSYLTAFGNPEKIGVANRRLIFAAVAVAVALFAKGFPTLIGSLLGANIPLQC